MSVGILLITHDDIGVSLVESLQQMLGTLPLKIKVLSIRHESEPAIFCCRVERLFLSLNEAGDGVLILTDLFGATPSNIACSLANNYPVRIICGVNLPMLVKIMNYPSSDLDTLATKALAGGCQGILDVSSIVKYCS